MSKNPSPTSPKRPPESATKLKSDPSAIKIDHHFSNNEAHNFELDKSHDKLDLPSHNDDIYKM